MHELRLDYDWIVTLTYIRDAMKRRRSAPYWLLVAIYEMT